jgi:hypothetical protein
MKFGSFIRMYTILSQHKLSELVTSYHNAYRDECKIKDKKWRSEFCYLLVQDSPPLLSQGLSG